MGWWLMIVVARAEFDRVALRLTQRDVSLSLISDQVGA